MFELKLHLGIYLLIMASMVYRRLTNEEVRNHYPWWVPLGSAFLLLCIIEFFMWVIYLCFII